MKKFKFLALAIFTFIFAACGDSNSTSTEQHEHFEVEGWRLYSAEWDTLYSVSRGKEDSKLPGLKVNANCMSAHIHVKFLDENKKEIAGPNDDEHSLGWDVSDKKILDIHFEGGWGFHLKGLKKGETTLILKVKHHDHADAKTPEIKVVVDKALDADKCPFQEDEDDPSTSSGTEHEHEGGNHNHEHDHE